MFFKERESRNQQQQLNVKEQIDLKSCHLQEFGSVDQHGYNN